MGAEQGPTSGRLEETPRFKLLRGISLRDGLGRRRLVTVPMTEYVGADALRTMRALLPGRPDAARDASGRKQPIP